LYKFYHLPKRLSTESPQIRRNDEMRESDSSASRKTAKFVFFPAPRKEKAMRSLDRISEIGYNKQAEKTVWQRGIIHEESPSITGQDNC
jgi:hypothetical protein